MAVAGVVAALAGCWRWLVVFVQLEAALADLRHVVVVVVGVGGVPMYENGNHQVGVEKVATGHSGFPCSTTTTNLPVYVLSQTQQRRPVTAIPTTTTMQRTVPATTTTTHRRRFNNSERRHDRDGNPSSNDDDNAIDSGSGTAITRQATAMIRMRWRGVPVRPERIRVLALASTHSPDEYPRHEYKCQSGKLGEYSPPRV
ncbi:hypothetical protein EDB89DRAFT_1912708 [Lactarius sanguifluus]|nr:hypothetical protein EDB89DRAFT_1912708 [Lactarius sanguifluus]